MAEHYPPQSALMTVTEAMAEARIGRTKFYQISMRDRAFPLVKIGRSTRVPRAEFREWLASLASPELASARTLPEGNPQGEVA